MTVTGELEGTWYRPTWLISEGSQPRKATKAPPWQGHARMVRPGTALAGTSQGGSPWHRPAAGELKDTCAYMSGCTWCARPGTTHGQARTSRGGAAPAPPWQGPPRAVALGPPYGRMPGRVRARLMTGTKRLESDRLENHGRTGDQSRRRSTPFFFSTFSMFL